MDVIRVKENIRMLDRKYHIQQYKKIRKVHDNMCSAMADYLKNHQDYIDNYYNLAKEECAKNNAKWLDIDFKKINEERLFAFSELTFYKNRDDIPSITEIFIKDGMGTNSIKRKVLDAMNDSYASLFKIVEADANNGYLTFKDVWSDKKFKIIDVSMSSAYSVQGEFEVYTYTRVIKYDDMFFSTGSFMNFSGENEALKQFIKNYKKGEYSDFVRTLKLREIIEEEDIITTTRL